MRVQGPQGMEPARSHHRDAIRCASEKQNHLEIAEDLVKGAT